MNLLDARLAFGNLPVVEVATTLPDGSPHVVPLWFLWRDEALYVSARRTSATWRNVERDPRVALTFHLGKKWGELAGAVIYGRADPLSPAHPALHGVMSAWLAKYRSLLGADPARRFHEDVDDPGMLRIRPERIAHWDYGGLREAKHPKERPRRGQPAARTGLRATRRRRAGSQ